MAQKLPGSKYKTNADKGIDIVKNLISLEVDNTIKILVPNFPFETNFYDTKDLKSILIWVLQKQV